MLHFHPMRFLKVSVFVVVAIGLLVWAHVIYRHVDTVLWLRRHGASHAALMPPLLLIPLAGFSVAAFLFMRGRAGPALATAIPTFALSILFWMSQAAAQLG